MKVILIGDSLTEGRPGVSFFNLLVDKYPDIRFNNHGKPGETIKSLYSRLSESTLETDYDIAFLWIGVNDVYSKLLKVQAQPITENLQEFSEYYYKVLNVILPYSKHVVVVSPAVVGENMNNSSNGDLRDLSDAIQSISNHHPNVYFLDMRHKFEKLLANIHPSDYISTGILTIMKDVFFSKKPTQIDRLSQKRGLHLTLDGIHLNSKGALTVANEYSFMIDQLLFNRNAPIH